ncbi:MAG TPA: aminotransferase class III-fold pyridoxal phosphate-dependent enzyme, partial [Nitrososphaeria archaeon]|nr:aminotransferase class III-fold pyridoxal phosphate-dependent enzyme [Nitrososphaeria archaeon]
MKDIPRISKPPTSGKAGEIISRDADLMSRSYRRAFPLVIKRVEGAVIEDVNGNSYIDFTGGLGFLPLGGNHPEIVKAIKDQLGESSFYNPAAAYHEKFLELAEELLRIAPIRGDVRFIFCDSGGEAIDLAIKAVKWHSGRRAILSFIGEYHGSIGESLTASTDLRSRRLLARISD